MAQQLQSLDHALLGGAHELDKLTRNEDVVSWLAKKLNRPPDSVDFFKAGKWLFQSGAYNSAAKILQIYVNSPGVELPGRHLLGHALWMTGDTREAARQLRHCVNHGFDSDWQLLVQLEIELEEHDTEAQEYESVRAHQASRAAAEEVLTSQPEKLSPEPS